MPSQNDLKTFPRFRNSAQFASKELTILLVEDEPAVLKATQRLLEYLGYQVLAANHGEKALAIYETHLGQIDLILTDLSLPGLNGMELAEAICQRNPQAKIVALSGRVFALGEIDQSDANVIDWAQKPLDLKGLAAIIERWLPQASH
jgi:CheY-like chemotaxis protein